MLSALSALSFPGAGAGILEACHGLGPDGRAGTVFETRPPFQSFPEVYINHTEPRRPSGAAATDVCGAFAALLILLVFRL